MTSRQGIISRVTAVAVFMAVLLLLIGGCATKESELVLRSGKTGEVFARYPLSEGDRFTVTFIHSVNQKPYSDTYQIEQGKIYVEETRYAEFGAGVQTELNAGETLSTGKNGEIVVSNIHKEIPHLSYIVGTVSDHILTMGKKKVSLRDLCGRNANVVFTFENK